MPDTVRDSNSTSLRGPAYQLDADPMRGFQAAAKNAQAQLALQYAVILFEQQQEEISQLRAELAATMEAMPVKRSPGRPRTEDRQPEREPVPAKQPEQEASPIKDRQQLDREPAPASTNL